MTQAAAAAPETIPLSVGPDEVAVSDCLPNSLPADLDYCLDCEIEQGGMGADERAYVDLFDEDTLIWFRAVLERADLFVPTIRTRYSAWRSRAVPGDRMALAWAGLRGLGWMFDSCAADLGASFVHGMNLDGDDVLPGGRAHALRPLVRPDLSPVKTFVGLAAPIVERACTDVRTFGLEAFLRHRAGVDLLYADAGERLRTRRRIITDEITAEVGAQIERARISIGELLADGKEKRTGKPDRRTRRVLWRSFCLLDSIVGTPKAKAWLSGDDVRVEGRRFDFKVRVANVRADSYGALEVFVTDKSSIELAKLCVYFPQTPALDQVAALVLKVISGDEDEILRAANVIRSTEAASGHDAFREVRASKPVVAARQREVIDISLPERIAKAIAPNSRKALAEHLRGTQFWRRTVRGLGEEVAEILLPEARPRDVTSPWIYDRAQTGATAIA